MAQKRKIIDVTIRAKEPKGHVIFYHASDIELDSIVFTKNKKKDDKKDGEAMKKGKYSEAEQSAEEVEAVAQAEAAEEALQNAEQPVNNAIASVLDPNEEQEKMRSSAESWIGSFINSKTK